MAARGIEVPTPTWGGGRVRAWYDIDARDRPDGYRVYMKGLCGLATQ